jgi:TonB-linked SusC/RagA family outer membrane protein
MVNNKNKFSGCSIIHSKPIEIMHLTAIPALKFKKIKGLFKVLLIMKIMLLLMLAFVAQAFAAGNAQVVTLSENNTSPKSVLTKIESQTGYYFWYENTLMDKIGPISVKFKKLPLKDALNLCFADQPVTYEIINRTILLKLNPLEAFREITGLVKDSSGNALGGATIAIKGTKKQVVSNADGRFSINAVDGDILVISFVGYESKEILINGGQTQVDITLQETTQEIEKIVVTALGIKRAEKALTYHVQEFKGEEVTRNKDANFVNALTGKIAGITINSSSSGIGGATRVVMRGTKSISGNNNALYVIDGIPIPNANGGTGSTGPFQGAVTGEGISSINPEDIESIAALTGPSAAALYGNQGANGVIMVTTKKGSTGKLKATFSHSTDFFTPFIMPRFQNTYGQEDPLQMQSWGRKLNTPSSYKPKDFFQTGSNLFNAISLSGGTEKSQTFFSAGANNAEGILPKNTFNRYNVYLRQTTQFTDRLTVDFNAMYVRSDYNNMIAQGQYHNPIVPVYLFPPGDDFRKYEVYERYDPDRRIADQFWPFGNQGLQMQNPYWITHAQSNRQKIDRYMLSVVAKYKLTDWMDITGRVRVDNSAIKGEVKRPAGTDGLFASRLGFYTLSQTSMKSTYADVIASIRHKLSSSLQLNVNAGASFVNEKSELTETGGNLTNLANFYTIENTRSFPATTFGPIIPHEEQAIFATAEFDYKRWIFLNFTGRNEWSSALAGANIKSYFYPSAGISAVLTEALSIPKKIISFAKLRFSYAEVGNAPAPGLTSLTLPLVQGGANTYSPAPFPEFQAERTRSYELGMELKFLRNKLSLNATVYQSNTYNQLLDYRVTGTLFTNYFYNAGNIANRGIEASLGYNNRFGELGVSSNLIFSLNRNIVKRLSEGYMNPATKEIFGTDSIRNGTVGNDLLNILAVGGSMSDLYVTQLLREDNQGNLWINPQTNGIEKVNIPARYIGRTAPDYNIGWSNSITYKNFDLSFLIDARVGGMGISYTQSIMDAYGVSEQSAKDRDRGGVAIYGKLYPDVKNYYATIGGASGGQVGMAAYYQYSATNVRLREAAFGYAFPGKFFNGYIQQLKLSVTGRNLFMLYNKAPFDPESASSTGTYYQGIDYFRQPSYRSIGFSLRALF